MLALRKDALLLLLLLLQLVLLLLPRRVQLMSMRRLSWGECVGFHSPGVRLVLLLLHLRGSQIQHVKRIDHRGSRRCLATCSGGGICGARGLALLLMQLRRHATLRLSPLAFMELLLLVLVLQVLLLLVVLLVRVLLLLLELRVVVRLSLHLILVRLLRREPE